MKSRLVVGFVLAHSGQTCQKESLTPGFRIHIGIVAVVCAVLATSAVARAQSVDPSFNPGADGQVNAFAIQADGKIVVGGFFWRLGGGGCPFYSHADCDRTGAISRAFIGRVNADGSLDTSFNPGAGNVVNVLAVQADEKVLVGGIIVVLGGAPRNYIGRLLVDAAPGDFNGDGKPDILWRNTTTGENILWYMNGAAYSSYAWVLTVADTNWKSLATADFNGDGTPDIFWRNTATGENLIWYMNGAAYVSYAWVDTVPSAWRLAGVADFNGDGKPDLLWRHTTTGENIVWYMNGAAYVSYAWVMTVADTNWRVGGVADFNADGRPDIFWRNGATGENIIWYMNGAAYSSYAWVLTVADTNWNAAMVADFNGDAKLDVLWRNSATGENIIWYLDNATYVSYAWVESVADTKWVILASGTGTGDISMSTPYVNAADIVAVREAFSTTTSAPWNFAHNGIDFFPATGTLKSFQAASAGTVSRVSQMQNGSNWQVNVGIQYNSTFSLEYVFETFSTSEVDGNAQRADILVSIGQTLSQGQVIGRLHTVGSGAHVHFGLQKNGTAICPEPYFTADTRQSVLALVQATYPGSNMCY